MDSILTSVKKMLGITEEYTHFDADIIMHINSVFMVLNQLGIGPPEGYMIEDAEDQWMDFVEKKDLQRMQAIKSYVFMKVRLMFDPPANSTGVQSMENLIRELEFRLNVTADNKPVSEEGG